MDFTLFASMFSLIDTATNTFVTDVSGRVISGMMPVITVGLTISFIIYGILCARGAVSHSLNDFAWRVTKISIIVSIVSAGGMYQTQIAQAIQHAPDELALTLLPNAANATAANMIDHAAGQGFAVAGDAFNKAGIFSQQGIAYVAFAVLALISTAALTLVGFAFIVLAKLMLAMLAAVGPLFILALLFKPTAGLFERWVAQVIGFSMLILMISVLFGLTIQIFGTYMSNVNFDAGQSFAGTIGGAVIISGAFILLLVKIADYAVGLGGGIAAGLWHESHIARGLAGNAVSAGKAGASGAVATGSAAMSAGKSAGAAVGRAVGKFRGSRAA